MKPTIEQVVHSVVKIIRKTDLRPLTGNDSLLRQMRHTILSQADKIKRLQTALKPFLDECEMKTTFRDPSWNSAYHIEITVTVAEAREAAEAAGGNDA